MKIFITGAAGFIGSKLAKSLIIGGNEILGYDNFHSQVHGLDSGLIQRVSQALLPLLSAWVEVVADTPPPRVRQRLCRNLSTQAVPWLYCSASLD